MHPTKDKLKQYPAGTPLEARAQLAELERDQIRRLIAPDRYVEVRRRLVRQALGADGVCIGC